MFTSDAAIHRAALVAAVASRRPQLRVLADSEAGLVDLQSRLEALFGPLPQADIIEPSDHNDPDWELRVVVPEVDAVNALMVEESLANVPRSWSVAPPRAVQNAHDTGVLLYDVLIGRVHATCTTVAGGGLVVPDLWRPAHADPALQATQSAILEALLDVNPNLIPRGPTGDGSLQAVLRRANGRAGIELWFGPEVFNGLDGDAVHALRLQALEGIAAAIAEVPALPLDPHLAWWPNLGGTTFIVWLATAPAPPLSGDQTIRSGAEPSPTALAAFLADDGFCHDLELQLLVTDPQQATDRLLEAGATHPIGSEPVWVDADGEPLFAPCWRIALDEPLDFLGSLTVPFRLVPGTPVGLDEEERWTDKFVHWGSERVAVRLRSGPYDVDREPTTLPRELTAADAALIPRLVTALGAFAHNLSPESILAVTGSDGREGVRIDMPPASIPDTRAILDALTSMKHTSLAAWIDVAYPRGRGVRIHVWARVDPTGIRTFIPIATQ